MARYHFDDYIDPADLFTDIGPANFDEHFHACTDDDCTSGHVYVHTDTELAAEQRAAFTAGYNAGTATARAGVVVPRL